MQPTPERKTDCLNPPAEESGSGKSCRDYCIHCATCKTSIPLIVLAVHVATTIKPGPAAVQ